ncbi:MAG: isoleucine--tRNA ligase [Pseudomonadota bacterium]|nr:isoleucine--tRNA ligase [Pseudomonadota bacterium]
MNQPTTHQDSLLVQKEAQVLAFWQKHQIFQKIQKQKQANTPYWYYDGPPFATGLPHHGHLLASTIKDVVARYQELKGHFVSRHFGWDCHGVPIEFEIDKQLGLSTQDAVAKLGHAGYNQACRNIVQRYTQEWEKTLERLGRWLDFDKPYKTMDTDFMESVWWAIGQLWQKGLIYQGNKVVPYSTALQTGLSNFEASSNYQTIQSPAVTVLLKLKDQDSYLAIWTTTPWTLPTNLAVCIGPHTYVKIHDPARKINIIVAQDCLASLGPTDALTVLETLDPSQLVGQAYEPLFSFESDTPKTAYTVLQDDFVTTTDGTGLVHCAPAHGEDDWRVCQDAGIEPICLVDTTGHFLKSLPNIGGDYFLDANKWIIKTLKDQGLIYKQDVIEHNYPFCWRSDTPLMYRTIPQWYVSVTKIKDKLLAANQAIDWVPEHIKHGRFGKWLENAKDWAISRNRYWGTPIPIWINDTTGKQICIDSLATLKRYTGKTCNDIHPEHVDPLTFSIEGEPGTYHRVKEVLDCWFESGSVPFAQWHYPFENKSFFESMFPAAFISEGIDQTRGWFYTLTVMAAALFDKPAFKHAIVSGIVLAEDGRKMSKRLKNYTPPDELMDTYGADALRLYLIQSNLVKAEEQRFSDHGVRDMTRRVQLPWWNACQFLITYAQIDQWRHQDQPSRYDHILDQWILSRLQSLIASIKQQMDSYHLHAIVGLCIAFLDDLTNTYVRLNRGRFWQNGMTEDKKACYSALYRVLHDFSVTMAPFTPFMSESVFQALKPLAPADTSLSIHMQAYPKAKVELIKPDLEMAVTKMQHILVLGRQQRNDAKIKIKTPLSKLTVIHAHQAQLSMLAPLTETIQQELNVKSIDYTHDESPYINLTAKINAAKLGRSLGKKIGPLAKAVSGLTDDEIRAFETNQSITLHDHTLKDDDLLIYRQAKPGSGALSNQSIAISLDLTLTQDLIQEGQAREVVSTLQKLRKEHGFEVSDRIHITITASPKLAAILDQYQTSIQSETLCTHWVIYTQASPILDANIDMDDHHAHAELRLAKKNS